MGYLYQENSDGPFKLSRSKIDLFVECPRCFYLDRRLGVSRPQTPGYPINIAIDELLKKEFDFHRAKGEPHPLMKHYGLDAVPFNDERMEEWRDSRRRGIMYHHTPTNLIIQGGIDDIWQNKKGELIIVDYKATSTTKEITLEDEYKQGYKRQVEIYQWILEKMGFPVSKTAYFVFCNGLKDKKAFDGQMDFEITLVSHVGETSWIEPTVFEIKKCLESGEIPAPKRGCQYCSYLRAVSNVVKENN
jgi:hypothetical protein